MSAFSYQTVSEDLFQLAVKTFDSYLSKIGDDYRGGGIFFESYLFEKIVSVGCDTTAYANRGEYFNCALALRWSGTQHDAWVKQLIKDFISEAREVDRKCMLAEGKEPTAKTGYANFNLPDDPVSFAFRDHLPKLIELKKKWDPRGKFNKWFSIPTS